jgi:hypothetical protein
MALLHWGLFHELFPPANGFGKASFEENAIGLGSVLYIVSRLASDVRDSD